MTDLVLTDRIHSLPIGERWNVCYRLEELSIVCQCSEDGCLYVEMNNCCQIILVCFTLFRFTASRYQQIDWLERCWNLSTSKGG
jgi:hypothetical protein